VANSSASTGVSWAGPMVTAGKNGAINGAFDIWQRGTSISVGAAYPYTADRWQAVRGGVVAGMTVSRQNSGLTGIQYCARLQRDSGNTSTAQMQITSSFESSESYRFAGQTVTYSFYARAGANYSGGGVVVQVATGTGTDQNGITSYYTGLAFAISTTSATPTTSWAKYSFSATLSSSLTELFIVLVYNPTGTASTNDYLEVTGVQLEVGSVATAFSRAGGTLQGELAACQRYYYRATGGGSGVGDYPFGVGTGQSSTQASFVIPFPVTMRTQASTSIDFSGLDILDGTNSRLTVTAITAGANGNVAYFVGATVASGVTQYRPYFLNTNNNNTGYIGFSAEL
jgi:hypothetical protein